MNKVTFFGANLNIVGSPVVWDRMAGWHKTMPGWQGFRNGRLLWQREKGRYIQGSVEPGGLQLSGKLPVLQWRAWLERFRQEASGLLGSAVGTPKDRFEAPENTDVIRRMR